MTDNASVATKFSPDLTPEQMKAIGTLAARYHDKDKTGNFFNVVASMKEWPDNWHHPEHPLGWFQWYEGYAAGKRTEDDERQIKRWLSFKARHVAQLQKADPSLANLQVQPRRRQALLNWGIAPGVDVQRALQAGNVNKYLEKVAQVLAA